MEQSWVADKKKVQMDSRENWKGEEKGSIRAEAS